MLKSAIHGCGRIAGSRDIPSRDGGVTTHAQAYHRLEGVSLAGASDRSVERARSFASTWGINACHDSLRDMLAAVRPDIVSICSRNAEHVEDLEACLSHPDCPSVILAEKPLCLDATEAARIEAAAADRQVTLLVNHSRRFDPLHREMAARIRSGAFGAFVAGNGWYYGGWQNNGTHMVDTVRMLLGDVDEWEDVRPSFEGRDDDPCLDVTLRINGASMRIEGVPESNFQLFEYEFRFQQARLRFEHFGSRVRCELVEVNAIDERELTDCDKFPRNTMSDPLYHAVKAAVATAQNQSSDGLEADHTEALKTMRLIWDIASAIQD